MTTFFILQIVFLIWCYLPIKENGTNYVYTRGIRPWFVKNEGKIDSLSKKIGQEIDKVTSQCKFIHPHKQTQTHKCQDFTFLVQNCSTIFLSFFVLFFLQTCFVSKFTNFNFSSFFYSLNQLSQNWLRSENSKEETLPGIQSSQLLLFNETFITILSFPLSFSLPLSLSLSLFLLRIFIFYWK